MPMAQYSVSGGRVEVAAMHFSGCQALFIEKLWQAHSEDSEQLCPVTHSLSSQCLGRLAVHSALPGSGWLRCRTSVPGLGVHACPHRMLCSRLITSVGFAVVTSGGGEATGLHGSDGVLT